MLTSVILEQNVLQKWNILFCGLYQQAFVFSKYKYGNPEVGVDFNGNSPGALLQGIDYSTYPVPRTFTFGLNINF